MSSTPAESSRKCRDKDGDFTVYTAGFPLSVTEQDLEKLISPFGKILEIMPYKPKGPFNGVVFVKMETREFAKKVIEGLNDLQYRGRTITARFVDQKNSRQGDRPIRDMRPRYDDEKDYPRRDDIPPPRYSRYDDQMRGDMPHPLPPPPPLPPGQRRDDRRNDYYDDRKGSDPYSFPGPERRAMPPRNYPDQRDERQYWDDRKYPDSRDERRYDDYSRQPYYEERSERRYEEPPRRQSYQEERRDGDAPRGQPYGEQRDVHRRDQYPDQRDDRRYDDMRAPSLYTDPGRPPPNARELPPREFY